MRVKQIISKSRNGNKMEVIASGVDVSKGVIQKTLHIVKENDVWKYFVGLTTDGKKVFAPIMKWKGVM